MKTLNGVLNFVMQSPVANGGRVIYTARDAADRLYTAGVDVRGTNGYVAVYDATTLENLYARSYFDVRVHSDELKRHLQTVADGYNPTH